MDKPQVDRIEGIPPAIAIDQTNPVRTSRSTVGTMTELADHLKLLFARMGQLFCRRCAQPVRRDAADSVADELVRRAKVAGDPRLVVTFPIPVPKNFREEEVLGLLEQQGYTRIHARSAEVIEVVQDRFRAGSVERARLVDALESAMRVGLGRVHVHPLDDDGNPVTSVALPGRPAQPVVWKFSNDLHCADCDIHYREPVPSLFSFNSPIGACDTCRGFGRTIGVDYGLVIPDESKTLAGGAIRPWQTESGKESQRDLEKHAKKRGVPLDVPWRDLDPRWQRWVIEGDDDWVNWDASWPGLWYGVKRYFAWLETKAYKMHIRVLLSKYRAYAPCRACEGARLKLEPQLYRIGSKANADAVLDPAKRYLPNGAEWSREQLAALPGLSIHDVMLLPAARTKAFFDALELPGALDDAADLLLAEVRTRLAYLDTVGLGYLTLDRQSRTLSGGEVQRINLTTALGTSLVNTLFVLDEPSIGLHPRDMGRVIEVMHKLRNAGNSLVVVEHDPQIMLAADRIMDIGPGPGERGGNVVFFGTPDELVRAPGSLTGDYLAGRKRADGGGRPTPLALNTPRLMLEGVTEHNLKNIDVAIPLTRLVCITGVSGSGKSTLVQDVLYAALLKHKGRPTETPGAHKALGNAQAVTDVVMVDQSPIGRTTRSNPASYVGAFDAIRELFARDPASKERGYTAGTFSFNSGNGRCPTCGGNGFEHVEMQFLSDVYIRCADCDGTRYRPEVLEIRPAPGGRPPKSIAQVLDLTVSEAVAYFAGSPEIVARLKPLAEVGLDYLKLGQPVPTLSGGEAQRLKLAGHLAEAAGKPRAAKGVLFLFDEPTTGLHFDDVRKLLGAFNRLLTAGHSLIVIEHNLDVIRAADWVIDLGPEGGDAGGQIVCEGTPDEVAAHPTSHTGRALREYEDALLEKAAIAIEAKAGIRPVAKPLLAAEPDAGRPLQAALRARRNAIEIHKAREHNLKNVDLEIPREKFTVVTGVSGSGKSTLAFDIVFGEGQRRYLESLNAYARQFVQPASRPDVDAVYGIPPTVAIEQRTSRGGRKSTVATLTEVYHFLRLFYMKLGTQHCPNDGAAIEPQSPEAIAARMLRDYRGKHVGILAPLVVARKGFYTDLAKWANGKGYTHLRVDGEFIATDAWPRLDRFKEHTIELPVADFVVTPATEKALREALDTAIAFGKGVVHVCGPLDGLGHAMSNGDPTGKGVALETRVFSTKRACPVCGTSYPELDPRLFSYNSKHGWCETCFGTGLKITGFDAEQSGEEIWWNEWFEGEATPCDDCEGRRLNPVALNVLYQGRSIAELAALAVVDAAKFFEALALEGREAEIARDILAEIRTRLAFLQDVGLGYLALDRSAPTLSGGEAQRIRLAAQLGSNLQGVAYILDEPTIGLHPRDNRILLDTLERLGAKGNTLLVVEHDEETIRRADHVVDLGPGAGTRGGEVVAQGTADELMASPTSLTGRFLREPLRHPLHPRRPVKKTDPAVEIEGITLHNLRNVKARVPLGRLVVVTGVSGSGKSTLARDILHANLQAIVADRGKGAKGSKRSGRTLPILGAKAIRGAEQVGRVLEVDQTPIGKTPRSCPATYVGFWDNIRRLFADTNEARLRGYTASRFSFNTPGGRCDQCEGQGLTKVEMSFLPDVKVTCDTCGGRRFNQETLAVKWKEKSIGDILAMSVDDAVDFFAAHPTIHHALRLLQDVGLGYLTLGQQSPTLSGGEAQRIKLVTELAKVRPDAADAAARPGRPGAQQATLYVLDEPTVGLHMADVEKLVHVLHRLVDAGNTVVVIEHNLDVMAEADWILDLGPEGGTGGGKIVAEGSPESLAAKPAKSHTSRVMAEFLAERGNPVPAVRKYRPATVRKAD
jgi:excinuclease ABC subunit A